MNSKFYLKRNFYNQLAKLTKKKNIIFFNSEFSKKLNETHISSVLKKNKKKFLGNFFQNPKFSNLLIAAILVKIFSLWLLYKFEFLGIEEFSKLP